MSVEENEFADLEEEIIEIKEIKETGSESGSELPDNKKEVFTVETQLPMKCFTKPIIGDEESKYYKIINVLIPILIAETIYLIVIANPTMRAMWLIVLMLIAAFVVYNLVIRPSARKEEYKRIRNNGEDEVSYTFYTDCMKLEVAGKESILRYDSAEYCTESEEFLMIMFPGKKSVILDKSECSEDRIDFLKNVVSEEKNTAHRKDISSKMLLIIIVMAAYMIMQVVCIVQLSKARSIADEYEYMTRYQQTTYESFIDCVEIGAVKDVVIYDSIYVEYTYVDEGKEKRYYTEYYGDEDILAKILNNYSINWEKKTTE